jgi:hypothetical protein
MLSPSDFNNAVPKFTNGNYASNPLNPQYIAEPSSTDYNRGVEPLQTLPAQWWNWFLNKFTGRFNKVNIYVKNIFNELAQILSIFNITPDGTEATPTTSQLKTLFACCYPEYVKTTACLVGTETTVNGHPLTGNVTVTRSDLGLGTSATVNTGTAVGCIPTVGTALGTTNNNILVTDATGKLKPSGITVDTAVACPLGTASAGVATTVARSDHVHPIPTYVNQAGYANSVYMQGTTDSAGFYYEGADSMPSWVWGAESSICTKLYNPSCFHVACADSATCAANAHRADSAVYADSVYMQGTAYKAAFYYTGNSGQPSWIWGAVSETCTTLFNPSNFHVACADSATTATSADSATCASRASWSGITCQNWFYLVGTSSACCVYYDSGYICNKSAHSILLFVPDSHPKLMPAYSSVGVGTITLEETGYIQIQATYE